MRTGLVADIQRSSVHDGPGMRTTVFLKGCPLHCAWCHNPECIDFAPQTLYYPDKCIGCGKCSEGCFAGAKVLCGTEMTAQQVVDEVKADLPYYGKEGGITVSGGEPLAQPAFTLEILRLCHEAGIHTAIETTMYRFDEEILAQTDFIMTDIKIWDSDKHLQYTGVRNEEILANIRKADALGKPILVRTPVISGVNDTEENIRQTAAFVSSLKNAQGYELLPYHPLGISKAKALVQHQQEFAIPNKKTMEELRTYAQLSR